MERLNELLSVLGLENRKDYLQTSSPAVRQQSASQSAACTDECSAVVLADEPTGNLDSKKSQEIIELLKMSNRKYSQTMVIITHDEGFCASG